MMPRTSIATLMFVPFVCFFERKLAEAGIIAILLFLSTNKKYIDNYFMVFECAVAAKSHPGPNYGPSAAFEHRSHNPGLKNLESW